MTARGTPVAPGETSNLFAMPETLPVTGSLAPSQAEVRPAAPSAFGELGYNLNQPVTGGAGQAVTVQGTGLELDVVLDSTRDLQVRLMSVASGTNYCALLPASDSGTFPVSWDSFIDCVGTAPFDPVNTPIDAISVRVLSTGALQIYDFCIDRLEEDVPIG